MIRNSAQAGSFESGDAMVRVRPADEEKLTLKVESKVSQRFSKAIQQTVRAVADELGVTAAYVDIIDRGALDFVLRARVRTALKRAMGVGAHG